MTDRDLLRAVLRTDQTRFVEATFATLEPGTEYRDNWHIPAMTHALARIERGECRRLVINVPPRSMKSITVSVAFTAWVLGRNPHRRIMAISYAQDLARKLGADTRTVMETAWYGSVFPTCRIAGVTQSRITTSERGFRLAGSVGGSILGLGADLIVVDDPIKALAALSKAERTRVKEFWDNTLYTRLDDKKTGAIVVVMQRLHEDDLVGHILPREDWEVRSIPAIATEDQSYVIGPNRRYHRRRNEVLHPDREPIEILERMRATLGTLNFSAQYQQQPIPVEGNVVRREWLRRRDATPAAFERVLCSWDTASTIGEASDWSVGTVWGAIGTEYHLLDVVRGKWEVPDLRRRILALHEHHRAEATVIEDTELGRAVTQDLRRSGVLRPILSRPRFDKEARMLAQSARFEAGQVILPREAPWLGDYLAELLAFPSGRHDDQVDSTSQALDWLTRRTPVERPRPEGTIGRKRRRAT